MNVRVLFCCVQELNTPPRVYVIPTQQVLCMKPIPLHFQKRNNFLTVLLLFLVVFL